jgi:hypothetical protein
VEAGADLGAAGGGAGGSAGAAAGGGGILDSLGSGVSAVGGALKSASPFVGAAGLGLAGYQGYQQKKQLNALNASEKAKADQAAQIAQTELGAAQPLLSQGNTLMSYLSSGTLPQEFQSQLDQKIAAAKAGVIQGYAARGMSTNPQQNSALQQDLAAVDQQSLALKGQLEQQLSQAGNQMVQTANSLLSAGLSATSLSAEIPIQLSKLNQELNDSMSKALANFAAAINGGNRGQQQQAA